MELAHHVHGDGWIQAPFPLSVVALALAAGAAPSQDTNNLCSALSSIRHDLSCLIGHEGSAAVSPFHSQ